MSNSEVVITFKAPREMLELIDMVSEKLKVSRSELIRSSIIYYVSPFLNSLCTGSIENISICREKIVLLYSSTLRGMMKSGER